MGRRKNDRTVHKGNVEQAISLHVNVDALKKYDDNPEKHTGVMSYCEPEELAAIILADTPDAIELYNNLEEMVEYIRGAMAANYVFPHPASQRDKIGTVYRAFFI